MDGPSASRGPTDITDPSDPFGSASSIGRLGNARVFGPTGVRLPDGTTRTLLCDPDVFALVVDSLGVPLDMGRHVRLATAAQRRALAARDGGCVFPGCQLPPAWCDVHHIDAFEAGGTTNLDRLAPLCRTHHGVSHRRGWTMHTTTDGWFWWQTPTGHTFWSQRHQRPKPEPAPLPETE